MDILKQVINTIPVSSLIANCIIGLFTIAVFYWYSTRNQNYWKKKGIPSVKSQSFLRSRLDSLIKPFHDIELQRYQKYGRIYGYFEGNTPILSVGDPEFLRNIFVKDFPIFSSRKRMMAGDKIRDSMLTSLNGENWKRVRAIVTPTFTTGKIKRLLGIFEECSRTLVKNFKDAAEKGEPIEVKRLYGTFTMDVIASSAFSTKIESFNDPSNAFVEAARNILKINPFFKFLLVLFPQWLRFLRAKVFVNKGLAYFADATLQIVEQRRKTEQTRNDFLQLLLDTAEEVTAESKSNETEKDITENYGKNENYVLKNVNSKKSLSFEELVAQCVIFFFAGYETTATTLSYVTYSLALNPDVQEKLIEEIDNVLKESNGKLTYEAIQNMKFLDNVISETLRMFPPVPRIERFVGEDYRLKDTETVIPKDMIITIPIYAIHRDPEFFPEPEKFDPDRFSPEERAKRNPYVYIPFSSGPRNCVGMRFALMEMKICLAYVLSNFRFKKCKQTKEPLDYSIGLPLLQPKAITVQIEVRKDAVKML